MVTLVPIHHPPDRFKARGNPLGETMRSIVVLSLICGAPFGFAATGASSFEVGVVVASSCQVSVTEAQPRTAGAEAQRLSVQLDCLNSGDSARPTVETTSGTVRLLRVPAVSAAKARNRTLRSVPFAAEDGSVERVTITY